MKFREKQQAKEIKKNIKCSVFILCVLYCDIFHYQNPKQEAVQVKFICMNEKLFFFGNFNQGEQEKKREI